MVEEQEGADGLDASAVRRALEALSALQERYALQIVGSCDSTNTALVDHPPADDGRVHVLVARRQTAGRGRRGRRWLAWEGGSLTFSALWRFAQGAPVPAGLSLVAGLALVRALEQHGLGGLALKWPNDVLLGGAKLAGVLVELIPGRGRTPAAVVGVGVNLRFPQNFDPAGELPGQSAVTALAEHLPCLPDPNRLLASLLIELDDLFLQYAEAGFAPLRAAWEARNAHAGLPVRIEGEGESWCGECVGVDVDGALLLRTESETGQTLRRVLSGEVSLRRVDDESGSCS